MRRWWGVAVLLVGLTASACSRFGSDDAAPATGTDETADRTTAIDPDSTAVAAELEALRASGDIDEIVVMRPASGGKPPDAAMAGGDAVIVGARHLLQAPGPDGPVELWVLRVRYPDLGPGLSECRVTVEANSSSGGCSPILQVANGGPPRLIFGISGNGSSVTLDLVGPAGTTHLIVESGDRRVGVGTIQGEALVTFAGCPDDIVIQAWRGDTMLVEEPAGGPFC